MKISNCTTAKFPGIKRLTKYFCFIVVLCFFNLIAIQAQDPNNLTSRANTQPTTTLVIQEQPESELDEVDLQNMLQKQQQTIQMMSNISKVLHDTAMAIIRKIG